MEQVAALMDELSEDDVDIFIEPPEGDLSEQDSAGEDAGGLLDNLTSQQLIELSIDDWTQQAPLFWYRNYTRESFEKLSHWENGWNEENASWFLQ